MVAWSSSVSSTSRFLHEGAELDQVAGAGTAFGDPVAGVGQSLDPTALAFA